MTQSLIPEFHIDKEVEEEREDGKQDLDRSLSLDCETNDTISLALLAPLTLSPHHDFYHR